MEDLTPETFRVLAQFRRGLRLFLRFSEELNVAHGSTQALYQLMLAVASVSAAGPPDIGRLAGLLGLEHHSAAELVQRGQDAGLVSREVDPTDQRRRLVSLTEHGQSTLAVLAKAHLAELRRIRAETFDILQRLG